MRIALALVMALTMTGCVFGDDDDGDPSKYVIITEIGKAYHSAYCTYATRCGLFPDAATCDSAALGTAGAFNTLGPDVIAAVGAGRVYYMGSNVKACLDAIAAQTCDETDRDGRVLSILIACRDIVRGTVDAGGACTLDAECISGSCSTGGTDSCVMGTCIGSAPPSYQPAQLNEPCSPYCAEGLYCDFTTTNVCRPLLAAGATCMTTSDCAYGTACITSSGTSFRTCKTPPALDQPCPDFVCRDFGHYCSSTTMTCKQVGLPPTACTSSSQCSPYYPCDFAISPNTCKKGPSLGQPCTSSTRCFDKDTFCDTTSVSPTCLALKANGSPCATGQECLSAFCDVSMCAAPPTCF